jgi:hypothetical protein
LDAEAGEFGFEGVAGGAAAAAAGEPGGEHQSVIRQRRGWSAVSCGDGLEGGQDDGAGNGSVGGGGEQVAGVVVEPVQDLDVPSAGQSPVGEVGLPQLVG